MPKRSRNISLTDLPRDILQEIAEHNPRGCAQLSKRFHELALLAQRTLNVSRGVAAGVKPEQLQGTLFKCVNLRALDVSHWPLWNDRVVKRFLRCVGIGQFRHLRALSMRSCNEVSAPVVYDLLSQLCPYLQYLDLQDCGSLSGSCLPHGFVKLKVLMMGVARSRGKTTNKDIIARLFSNGKAEAPILEYLCLQNRSEVRSLAGIELLSTTLKVLDLRGCSDIPPEEYARFGQLKQLEQLLVGSVLPISILSEIIRGCPKLTVLDISGSEMSLDVIDLLCHHQRSLKKLKLTRCTALTNEGLSRLLACLPKLSVLDVSHCWRLSDSFLNNLGQIPSPNDLSLGIYNCSMDKDRISLEIGERKTQGGIVKVSNRWEIQIYLTPPHEYWNEYNDQQY